MSNTKRKRSLGWLLIAAGIVAAFWLGLLISDGSSDSNPTESDSSAGAKAQIWTCSMHPNIRLPKPGKCPICFMDLIPLESSADDSISPRQLRMSAAALARADVQTAPVTRQRATREVRMSGQIAVDETRLANISAYVPGRLERLYADYTGVTVKEGEPLALVYSPELNSAQEELLTARSSLDRLSDKASPALRRSMQTTLDASREKLKLYGLTEMQIEQLLKSGQVDERISLNAPIGGVVLAKLVNEGGYVKTGEKIYTIADLSRLWLILEAYESDLSWLGVGQKVNFTVESLPGERFTGKISFIDPVIDPRRRIARVRAVVDNQAGQLKPNMFVSAVVAATIGNDDRWLASKKAAGEPPLLIPATAALLTGTRAIVYVALNQEQDGSLFEGRTIELGPRSGAFYIVKSGLSEGERVVTNGAFKIDAELQLQAKPSMMSPAGEPQSEHHQQAKTMTAVKPSTSAVEAVPAAISSEARAALTPVYQSYFEV